MGSPVTGLVAASHPVPCLAVTGFVAAWALANTVAPARVLALCVVVLVGQTSVGWGNDALDAARDRRAGRYDKPIPAGRVSRRTVAVAAALALVATVPGSLALGVRPGLLHLVAVAAGWSYNLGVKSTWASAVPYALAFGLAPSVVVTTSPVWVNVIAGLLGVAAHFANTVGDTEADAATGVCGLPQRVGPDAALRVSAALVATAGALLLTASSRAAPSAGTVAGAVAAASGAAVALLVAAAGARLGRRAFLLTLLAVAALVVVGVLLAGPGR